MYTTCCSNYPRPVLIKHLWLLKTVVFLHWLFQSSWSRGISEMKSKQQSPCSISLWCHGAMHAVNACIGLWHHGPFMWLLHALTAWDLKFQVCLGYTFTPATVQLFSCIGVFSGKVKRTSLSRQCSNYNLKRFIRPVSAEMNDRPNRNKCIEAFDSSQDKKEWPIL